MADCSLGHNIYIHKEAAERSKRWGGGGGGGEAGGRDEWGGRCV